MTQYTCADTYNAAALFKNEVASVAMQEMLPLYNQEMEDTVVFYDMERIGMKIDPTYEKPIKDLLETQASEAERHYLRRDRAHVQHKLKCPVIPSYVLIGASEAYTNKKKRQAIQSLTRVCLQPWKMRGCHHSENPII